MDKVSRSQNRYLGLMIGCLVVIVLIFAARFTTFTCRQLRNVGFVNMMKGLTNSDSEKFSRAKSAFLSSDKINDTCGIYGLALLAMYENENAQAISLWETLVDSDTPHRQASFFLGNILWLIGNEAKAIQYWRESDAQVYWTSEADWHRTERQTEEAIRYYEKALLIHPDWEPAQRGLALIYHGQISELWEAERFETAMPLLLQVIDLDPRPWDYVRLGDYARNQGNDDDAFRWYSLGKEVFPNFVFYPFRMGRLAFDHSDWSVAEAYFKEAIQIDATNAQAYFWLGIVYLEQGELLEAEKAFKTKIELLPDKWTYARLGDVYLEQGRLQDAVEAYQQALSMAPDFVYAQKQLSNVLELQSIH